MKLFACYLGGEFPGCRIEAHDVAFCVGHAIEACYESIRAQWPGVQQGLHIDAYAVLERVDGYRIILHPDSAAFKPASQRPQLYFINLGGYQPNDFSERHQTGFFVADSPDEAKRRAKQCLGGNLDCLHTDDIWDIDDCLALNDHLPGYTIELVPDAGPCAGMTVTCGYFLLPEQTGVVAV